MCYRHAFANSTYINDNGLRLFGSMKQWKRDEGLFYCWIMLSRGLLWWNRALPKSYILLLLLLLGGHFCCCNVRPSILCAAYSAWTWVSKVSSSKPLKPFFFFFWSCQCGKSVIITCIVGGSSHQSFVFILFWHLFFSSVSLHLWVINVCYVSWMRCVRGESEVLCNKNILFQNCANFVVAEQFPQI